MGQTYVSHIVKQEGLPRETLRKRKWVVSSLQRKQDVKRQRCVTVSNNTHSRLSFSQVTARETDTELALDPAWEPSSLPYNTKTLLLVWLSSWFLQKLTHYNFSLDFAIHCPFHYNDTNEMVSSQNYGVAVLFLCDCKPVRSCQPHNLTLFLLYHD